MKKKRAEMKMKKREKGEEEGEEKIGRRRKRKRRERDAEVAGTVRDIKKTGGCFVFGLSLTIPSKNQLPLTRRCAD